MVRRVAMFAVIAVTALSTLAVPRHVDAQTNRKISLTLATWGSSSHPQVQVFAKQFMEGVTRRSGGSVEWKFFPDDTMVKQAFVPTAIPGGQVDIALTTLDNWTGRIPEVSITASPLWTFSMIEAREALKPGQPLFAYFDELLAKQNTKLLSAFDIGPPAFFSKFEIRSPESIKGRTLRAFSKGVAETLQSLGAAPVNMSVGDVYSGLQRGAIDGTLGGLQGAFGLRHYEVTSHLLGTGGVLGALINGYVMNLRSFQRLPDNVRAAISDSAVEAQAATVAALISSYQKYLSDVAKHGLKVSELKSGSSEWVAWEQSLEARRTKLRTQFPPKAIELVTRR